uniref:non-specific serine/threonine protein kinase n=1 Tax=Kalanchoe fedtschenkoi TaxID=63787 RepID=A0A7N0T627_KALFE
MSPFFFILWGLLFSIIALLLSSAPSSSARVYPSHINVTCRDTCGAIPLKFPFGSGPGCGHPDFARYVECSAGVLQLSTATGLYAISSIDYSTSTLALSDPLMSTCSAMQNSGSFSLGRDSPFSLMPDNVFVLLGCSTTSPVYDQNEDLCDNGSRSRACRGLYSCKAVAGLGLRQNAPASTCCVYESPVGVGSGFRLDLPKLQCSSYSSIYGYGDDEGDPMKWKYGIALRYNGSYDSDTCKDCEASSGLCGYSGVKESFSCICRNGMNTSNNCLGRGYAWSGTMRIQVQTGRRLGVILLMSILLILRI